MDMLKLTMLIFSIIVNFLIGLILHKKYFKNLFLNLGIIFNLSILAYCNIQLY